MTVTAPPHPPQKENTEALIEEARRRARAQFGVTLEPEVQVLGRIAIPPLVDAA